MSLYEVEDSEMEPWRSFGNHRFAVFVEKSLGFIEGQ